MSVWCWPRNAGRNVLLANIETRRPAAVNPSHTLTTCSGHSRADPSPTCCGNERTNGGGVARTACRRDSRRIVGPDYSSFAFEASDLADVRARELQSHASAHAVRLLDDHHAEVTQPSSDGLDM